MIKKKKVTVFELVCDQCKNSLPGIFTTKVSLERAAHKADWTIKPETICQGCKSAKAGETLWRSGAPPRNPEAFRNW